MDLQPTSQPFSSLICLKQLFGALPSSYLAESEEAVQALGAQMAQALIAGIGPQLAQTKDDALLPAWVIAIEGPMGAGKSLLTRSLLQALGVQGPIPSPTYPIVESYTLPKLSYLPAYHWDWYRLQLSIELEPLGFEDELAKPSLHLIEWPSRLLLQLPEDYYGIQIQVKNEALRCFQLGVVL